MIKQVTQGSEGLITSYAFRFLGMKWVVALSETKWHHGERFKRAPIWASNVRGEIWMLFIWKLAIGFNNRKQA